jgi:hypothetical protein
MLGRGVGLLELLAEPSGNGCTTTLPLALPEATQLALPESWTVVAETP